MPLTNSNNYLHSILDAGTDAFNNLYEVSFTGGNLTDIAQQLKIRCDGFSAPQISQDSYSVRYINAFIDRPRAQVNVTRNFTLTFRVDANFEVFKTLLAQQGVSFNPQRSFTATNITELKNQNKLFDVEVSVVNKGIDSETISTMTLFKFNSCWISGITPVSYSYANADAASVTVTINFLTMEDLASGITGSTTSPNVILGQS